MSGLYLYGRGWYDCVFVIIKTINKIQTKEQTIYLVVFFVFSSFSEINHEEKLEKSIEKFNDKEFI